MRLRPAVAAVTLPLLSLTLAACGESAVDAYAKTPPATVDQDLRDALNGLTSIHVHTVQRLGTTPFIMDISVDSAGRCQGTLSQGTQTLSLIGLGGDKVYARASADFWQGAEGASATAAAALADRWVTGLPSGIFSNTCSIKSLVQSFTGDSIAKNKPTLVGKTKVDGIDAVSLQILISGTKVTIAVQADKPHRPLRVISSGGKLTSVFTQFDQPIRPTAPAGAQDLSALTGTK